MYFLHLAALAVRYKTHQIESGVLEGNIKRANSRADHCYFNWP